jgi:acetyl coenzyme A synthetase (ADP forming)-like protein
MSEPRAFALDAVLRDGGSIHLRAIRPDDKARLVDHFQRLSARSVYFRFFGSKLHLTDSELRRFTELDFVNHVALVATLLEGGEERIIGVARYIVLPAKPGEPRRAEVAFAVADAHQGRGIATLLLEQLAHLAEAGGIDEFEANVLGENNRMLEVFGASGFQVRRSIDGGVFHVTFPTRSTEEAERAHHARERAAAAQSIRPFLSPGSVAVVGASTRRGSIGNAIVVNLVRCGFTGPIYPVNPAAKEVEGLAVYPRISAIPRNVDLAVVAVPAAAVEGVVADASRAGVHGVVIISSGFAEVSDEGRAAQARLRDLVRSSGMRMIGPNCVGVLNTDPAVSLNATFAPHWPPAGAIGMLSQSGALGLAMLDYAKGRHIGVSSFVSVGNKADVSSNDLLAYWADDPRTRVVVLYLESFGNPRKFARVAPELARKKPIVAIKAGRSTAGVRAAASHSAALAILDVAVDALFEQAGVIRTKTMEELFDAVELLSLQPPPAGRRVAIVTNAGGPAILAADACESRGLELPPLAPATIATLNGFLPAQAGLANPVDMIAAASAEDYARTIAAVASDPGIDSIIAMHVPTMVSAAEAIGAGIARGAAAAPAEKPVIAVYISANAAPASIHGGRRGPLPCYPFPENAAIALAAAERYGRWRRRERGDVLALDRFAVASVRAVVDRVLAAGTEPCWLSSDDVATLLRAAGIGIAASERVAGPEAGAAAAERIGYPLVAKLLSPDILHKSDVGGVILGLHSAAEVSAAVSRLGELARSRGARFEGVLLQREVRGGSEALVGVTTDPTFGPLLLCGLGGVLVELLRDVSFRLTPVSRLDAEEMIAGLRSAKLLDGYRGAPAGDRAALVGVIQRISALVEVVPEIRELDLNPVKILEPGRGAVVVDARVRLGWVRT